jgi:hypothetical protein
VEWQPAKSDSIRDGFHLLVKFDELFEDLNWSIVILLNFDLFVSQLLSLDRVPSVAST